MNNENNPNQARDAKGQYNKDQTGKESNKNSSSTGRDSKDMNKDSRKDQSPTKNR